MSSLRTALKRNRPLQILKRRNTKQPEPRNSDPGCELGVLGDAIALSTPMRLCQVRKRCLNHTAFNACGRDLALPNPYDQYE